MGDESLRDGMGTLTLWGTSPACDLTEFLPKEIDKKEMQEPSMNSRMHVLLMGQADARHILKTLSLHIEKDFQIQFYIVEGHPLLYARQLLFLYLTFIPLDKMGLHEKTTEFMEIFGNIQIRPQTKKTIRSACESLIKLVTDDKALKEKLPMLILDDLKYREKDYIVDILKYWAEAQLSADEMQKLWDNRVRQYLKTRYDSRMGIFDWDYHMRVLEKNKEANIIHISEFKTWRKLGLAFTEYQSDYNQSNITLLSGKGEQYLGDILVGPFIPFGIHSNDSTLFEKANDQYKKKSFDLTFSNLQKIFSALSPKTDDITDVANMYKNFKVNFLPLDASQNLWKKSKFIEKFDIVYISNYIGHKIQMELVKLLKSNGVVVVDQTRFIWYFRKENDKAYEKKVLELCDSAGLKMLPSSKEGIRNYIKFEISKNSVEIVTEAQDPATTCLQLKAMATNGKGDEI